MIQKYVKVKVIEVPHTRRLDVMTVNTSLYKGSVHKMINGTVNASCLLCFVVKYWTIKPL